MDDMRGFTIIEMVIVIMVIGIMAAIAIPLWPGTSVNVSAQADLLASDLMYTQNLAMHSGNRYHLIRASSTTYQVRDDTSTPIQLPGRASTTITLDKNITFGTFTNLPNNLVAFDGQGIPYTTITTPGTKLTASANIPLVGPDATKTITIEPNTGWVNIA